MLNLAQEPRIDSYRDLDHKMQGPIYYLCGHVRCEFSYNNCSDNFPIRAPFKLGRDTVDVFKIILQKDKSKKVIPVTDAVGSFNCLPTIPLSVLIT